MFKSFEIIVSKFHFYRIPSSWKLKQSPFKYNKMRWGKNHKRETECLQFYVIPVSNVLQFLWHWQKLSQGKTILLVTDLFLISLFFFICHQGTVKPRFPAEHVSIVFCLFFIVVKMMYSILLCGTEITNNILTIKKHILKQW